MTTKEMAAELREEVDDLQAAVKNIRTTLDESAEHLLILGDRLRDLKINDDIVSDRLTRLVCLVGLPSEDELNRYILQEDCRE